jgi:KaiC/GvpD/RAD55 family RecA-like ATPase
MAEQGAAQYDLFIAHAPADRAWVDGYLADALRQAGLRWYALAGLKPPQRAEVESTIAASRRVLLILSPAYVADGFTEMVALLARQYGTGGAIWPVSPLLLQPVQLPARLPFLPTLDATDPRKWLRVINRLCSELGHPMRGPVQPPPCPYPGLRAFSAADVPRFYGRDAEVGMLLGHLRREQFVLVTGPSGVGKTSLIEAGLIPQLPNSPHWPPGFWVTRTMRPGVRPVQALAEALQASQTHPREVLTDLLAAHFPAGRVLLVIDSFEELFTLNDRDEQTRFLAALSALRADARCALALVMRSDFYPDLMTSPLWPIPASQRLEVEPLSGTALRMAVQQPALGAGVQFEGSLLGRLLADANTEPTALPLLQETLVKLWSGMEWRLLAGRTYARLSGSGRGGLAAAFVACVESTFRALAPAEQTLAQRLFLRLVQLGEGRPDTARPQLITSLHEPDDDPTLFLHTIQHLAAGRLITLSGPDDDPGTVVQIAHEVLIVRWPRLRTWLREARATEQAQRAGEQPAPAWLNRDIAHWLAQPTAEPVGVAVSPLVKRNGNGHGNGNGAGKPAVVEAEPARRELAPAPLAVLEADLPPTGTVGERARVQAPVAVLDLFRDRAEPGRTGPVRTTVLEEPDPSSPAAEPDDTPASLPDPPAPGEAEPEFALPTWTAEAPAARDLGGAYEPAPPGVSGPPGVSAPLPPPAPDDALTPTVPPSRPENAAAPEDARDQAITAARERLARLAVLRAEEDRRHIEVQARAERLQRLLAGAGLLLLALIIVGLILLLGGWGW